MVKFSRYLRTAVRRLRFLQFWGLYALTLCFLGAAGAPGTGQTGQEPAARRPNVLFLFPDNMRAQAMACMGNPDVRTPNLDRLAAEGILFRQTFSNGPECSPARAMMLTGKYTHRNGMNRERLETARVRGHDCGPAGCRRIPDRLYRQVASRWRKSQSGICPTGSAPSGIPILGSPQGDA